jgi:hypothetical protein
MLEPSTHRKTRWAAAILRPRVEAALTLRLLFRLPLRQVEGGLRSILSFISVHLEAPDHTTLSRRSQQLDVGLGRIASRGPIHLFVASTGLSIVGQGEWAAVKHGDSGKRASKKLHLGIDRSGSIVAGVLAAGNADDLNTAFNVIDRVTAPITNFTADAAHDTTAIYEAAGACDAKASVPPRRTTIQSRQPGHRDRTVARAGEVGHRRWKKKSGDPEQPRVENIFFRYKSIIGGRLQARHPEPREAEALIKYNLLHRKFELGRPKSFAISG